MSYIEVIKYLNSFVNYEKKNSYDYKELVTLERAAEFLKIIGNPQQSFKSVHVAGTKGKGSVCAFSAYILRECGFKAGLFTSPHLTDIRERIRILRPHTSGSPFSSDVFEGMIPKKDLMDLAGKLKSKIDKFCAISKYGPLSFFEVYTIFAFAYFKEQKVDYAVLETGMGGRLDATNVVAPVICGISSISYDHTKELGNSLAEITEEKAGIIKSCEVPSNGDSRQGGSHKLIVVSAPQEEEVISVLKKRCVQEGALFYEIGKDIKLNLVDSNLDYQEFSIKGNLGKFNNLRINFLGRHQLVNAALAVSLVSGIAIRERFGINLKMFKKGLERTFWPARFERISLNPLIILDGAHNEASASVLVETVKHNFPAKKIIIVLGISRDKNIKGIAREFFPVADKLILTRADNPRAARPDDILSAGKEFLKDKSAVLTRSVEEALKIVYSHTPQDSLVLVTGSLFVAGEARAIISNSPGGRQGE